MLLAKWQNRIPIGEADFTPKSMFYYADRMREA
jgi:hypothetical protein